MSTEYRIEYVIQRALTEDNDFEEIGFGSSGAWDDLDQCAHILSSDIQNDSWETEAGQPDPDDIRNDITEAGR